VRRRASRRRACAAVTDRVVDIAALRGGTTAVGRSRWRSTSTRSKAVPTRCTSSTPWLLHSRSSVRRSRRSSSRTTSAGGRLEALRD